MGVVVDLFVTVKTPDADRYLVQHYDGTSMVTLASAAVSRQLAVVLPYAPKDKPCYSLTLYLVQESTLQIVDTSSEPLLVPTLNTFACQASIVDMYLSVEGDFTTCCFQLVNSGARSFWGGPDTVLEVRAGRGPVLTTASVRDFVAPLGYTSVEMSWPTPAWSVGRDTAVVTLHHCGMSQVVMETRIPLAPYRRLPAPSSC